MTLLMGASIVPLGKKTVNAWLEHRGKNMIVPKQVVEKRVSCTAGARRVPQRHGEGSEGRGQSVGFIVGIVAIFRGLGWRLR